MTGDQHDVRPGVGQTQNDHEPGQVVTLVLACLVMFLARFRDFVDQQQVNPGEQPSQAGLSAQRSDCDRDEAA